MDRPAQASGCPTTCHVGLSWVRYGPRILRVGLLPSQTCLPQVSVRVPTMVVWISELLELFLGPGVRSVAESPLRIAAVSELKARPALVYPKGICTSVLKVPSIRRFVRGKVVCVCRCSKLGAVRDACRLKMNDCGRKSTVAISHSRFLANVLHGIRTEHRLSRQVLLEIWISSGEPRHHSFLITPVRNSPPRLDAKRSWLNFTLATPQTSKDRRQYRVGGGGGQTDSSLIAISTKARSSTSAGRC
ncbi:hypothetical protein B0T19DRAFT_65843 [Cercophora scortea]|uniref:Uncharacterized protein n=1 Tax=Cercophora scortea TaxID=314031 RepID=A0AAE0J5C9_9PEZI|nr:hypothetical protein B0T19DRAFT_65843 [Cercophora scortea]